MVPARDNGLSPKEVASGLIREIRSVVCVFCRRCGAFMRGNLHRPCEFGRNGTVFGVAPPHNVEALARRRSPKSGTVALRNLVTLSLAGTTSPHFSPVVCCSAALKAGPQLLPAIVVTEFFLSPATRHNTPSVTFRPCQLYREPGLLYLSLRQERYENPDAENNRRNLRISCIDCD